ncbi:MAG: alfa-L-rhamnosidase, partial [Capsulimonas sp.]|nr:alfa-L-rhamnosidase [Capsulimonas sp.]
MDFFSPVKPKQPLIMTPKTLVSLFYSFTLSPLLLTLASNSYAAKPGVSSFLPAQLRCDYLTAPLGIDDLHPSLSWISLSRTPEERGQNQSAYQVEVASSADGLARGAYLWNSSKVVSSQSMGVKYGGASLRSHMQCFWRVRVWDQAGRLSGWSKPALWTMGVLSPSEWKAKWIDGASQETRWRDFTVETSFTIQHEAAAIYFRASGPGKAYMWQITTAGDHPVFRPHARVNGFYEVLKDVSLAPIYTNADFQKPHTLRITASGTTITTYLDGRLIDTTVDDKLASGSIGFRGSSTETATFHRVRVTDLAGKVQYENKFPANGDNAFRGGALGPDGLTVANTDAMLESGNPRTPMLRREFSLTRPIRRAWLYASALGIYTARINGKRVSDHYYAPGWTNYYRRAQYQCYDVTPLLKRGGNAIGAQIAPGWYCGNIAWFGPNQYGSDCPKFFAELHVQYTDGSQQIVASDQSWKLASGPITQADNLDGEHYDARQEHPGWDLPKFNDKGWSAAHIAPIHIAMTAQMDPPIRATQIIPSQSVTQPQPGVYIYKLPQDITGVARVRIEGKPGTTVTIRQGEVLNSDGTLNLITLESPGIPGARADAIDRYTFGASGKAV